VNINTINYSLKFAPKVYIIVFNGRYAWRMRWRNMAWALRITSCIYLMKGPTVIVIKC
jgi:hypothetical protein